MTTKKIREQFHLTQKQISEKFDIPFATIKNWDARDCMPEYVYKMIVNYLIKSKQYELESVKRLFGADSKYYIKSQFNLNMLMNFFSDCLYGKSEV